MEMGASAVESYNKGLVSARSKLRVESVRKAWDGMSMSTNSVASVAELEVIKQWLKKTAGLGEITEVEPRLPQSKSFLKVLGVPYWDSKTHFVVTTEKTMAEGLARLFRDNVWKLHGLPESVISDRRLQFAAGMMKELNKMLGIETKLSMAYHPETDGQTERTNQKLEQYLRMYVNHRQNNWAE